MEKPSKQFFDTLGQYVYQYIDSEGKVYYVGKGNGDRCTSHVLDKGFNLDECYIIARNLEKFENKKDWQSFLLESYLISTINPDGNSVSGHYKECFTMASLSSMFAEFKNDQYDMFSQFPDWYIENYSSFAGKIREIRINSSTAFFQSNSRNKMYMMWSWSANNEDPIKVTFEISLPEGQTLLNQQKTLQTWLKANGYNKFHEDGKVQKFAIFVDDTESLVNLFNEFMS